MKKFIKNWKLTLFLSPFILAGAIFLRLYHLTILPVFADEAIYIRWAQVMGNEPTLRFLPLSDGKQPMFMWILMFMVHRFSDPLFVGRFLSALCGIGSLIGIFFLSYTLFKSQKAALASAIVYAVCPFALFFDRMALVDSMLSLFTIWTLLFGILTAKTFYPSLAILTGFTLGGAALTKSPALFVAIMLPTVWIINLPKNRKKIPLHFIKAIGLLLITYIIALGLYNILRLGPNFQLLASRTEDYVLPISHLWKNPTDPFKFNLDRARQWIWIMGPSFLYFLVAISLLVKPKKFLNEKLLLLFWFVFPLSINSMFAKVFTARYILYTLPPLFILSGLSFSYTNKKVLQFIVFFFAFFIAQALVYDKILLTDPVKANLPRSERSGYLEEWTAGTGIREVADYMKNKSKNLPAGKQIVIGTEGYFGTLPDGLEIYLDGIPNITIIGVGLNIKGPNDSLLASQKAGNETFLLANTSRLAFEKDPSTLGLKLIASYQKADRPGWSKENLLYGPHDYLQLFELQ